MAKRGRPADSCCANAGSTADQEQNEGTSCLRRMRSRSFDDIYLNIEAPDKKQQLQQFIALGGAFMVTNPDDMLQAALTDTDLPLRQPTSKTFGIWRFDYSDIPRATWERELLTIQRNLTALRTAGSIRYCSWNGKAEELRAMDVSFEEIDAGNVVADLFEGCENAEAADKAAATSSSNRADAQAHQEDFAAGVGQKVPNATNHFAQQADAIQRL